MCDNCRQRPASVEVPREGIQDLERWCHLCSIRAQVAFWRARNEPQPELEATLAEMESVLT